MEAFKDCESLTKIDLPYSVEIIEQSAFENCFNLRKVTYAGSKEDWSYNRVYSSAFRNCPVTKVHCKDGVTDIYI